ncbi:hypothetical protein HJG60_009143 [Phyllostomus discolor]|uniref:Uncharacterized protein n=1 Tax=Phyllostomus discolor TaxID=89673 RepID=A0A833YM63_9CHIR|nr:hypothetical protein HJG60_009143 [Phyllostomus discolor]
MKPGNGMGNNSGDGWQCRWWDHGNVLNATEESTLTLSTWRILCYIYFTPKKKKKERNRGAKTEACSGGVSGFLVFRQGLQAAVAGCLLPNVNPSGIKPVDLAARRQDAQGLRNKRQHEEGMGRDGTYLDGTVNTEFFNLMAAKPQEMPQNRPAGTSSSLRHLRHNNQIQFLVLDWIPV